MQSVDLSLITTDTLHSFSNENRKVDTLRLDKMHPVINGNKWFKLQYYLQEAIETNKQRIVTFGGYYSNHIVATAAACQMNGLQSIGMIRGEAPKVYSHTLQDAMEFGMQFVFMDRTSYAKKIIPTELLLDENYFIPEGGYGFLGAKGSSTLPINNGAYDAIFCAVGSGTMMAGLINKQGHHTDIHGISVMKNNHDLEEEVKTLLLDPTTPFTLHHDYHHGGYAKYDKELIDFMNEFYCQENIPTDFVYSAKLFFAVKKMIERDQLGNGKILIIHCGGLQGNLSLPKGLLNF